MNPHGHRNRRIDLVLVAALLGACASSKDVVGTEASHPAAVETAPKEEVFRRASASLVRLETTRRYAGGFVVGGDGMIVTTYSVLQDELAAHVVLFDGSIFSVERVLAVLPDRDLALVSIADRGLPSLELSSEPPPSPGQRVFVVGHGLGMAGPAMAEVVVGLAPSNAASGSFEVAGPLPAGFFGAPVLDASGRAVGIVVEERSGGATVMTAASIASMLDTATRGPGESLQAFGTRTRDADGWQQSTLVGENLLEDCSSASRERMWGEIERAMGAASPIFDLGAHEASFRVLEGAVFYLAHDLPDCKAIMDAMLTEAARGRGTESATEAATRLAIMLEAALDLLFEESNARAPKAQRGAR
jgi:hypothetical protein